MHSASRLKTSGNSRGVYDVRMKSNYPHCIEPELIDFINCDLVPWYYIRLLQCHHL